MAVLPADKLINEFDNRQLFAVVGLMPATREKIFRGFRCKLQSLKNPVIMSRIVAEANTDTAFREALTAQWVSDHIDLISAIELSSCKTIKAKMDDYLSANASGTLHLALLADDRKSVNALAKSLESAPDSADQICQDAAEDIADIQALENKLQKAQEELGNANDSRDHVKAELIAERKLRASAERSLHLRDAEISRLKLRIGELTRLQSESSKLAEKSLKDLQKAIENRERLESKITAKDDAVRKLRAHIDKGPDQIPAPSTCTADWQQAVTKLVSAAKPKAALSFLNAMTHVDANCADAHHLLVDVHAYMKNPAKEVHERLWLGEYYLKTGCFGEALRHFGLALVIDIDSESAAKAISNLFARVDPANVARTSDVRKALLFFFPDQMAVYNLTISIAQKTSKKLSGAIVDLGQSSILDRPQGNTPRMTARQMIEAVDRNDVEKVDAACSIVAHLRKDNRKLFDEVSGAIKEIDPSYMAVLGNGETVPLVVDGSNVAHSNMPQNAPLAQNIVCLVRKLRQEGYFPIYIVADAALRFQMKCAKEQHALEKLEMQGLLEYADGKTDGDEFILQRARQYGCDVVTNDHMHDWDPDNQMGKIRYHIYEDMSVEIL